MFGVMWFCKGIAVLIEGCVYESHLMCSSLWMTLDNDD